jgi:hypothetical protein
VDDEYGVPDCSDQEGNVNRVKAEAVAAGGGK